MKLYSINHKPGENPFPYVVIESYKGITSLNSQYLARIISKDFDNTLFVHYNFQDNKNEKSDSKQKFLINDINEIKDYYMELGVKHFMIIEREAFSNNNSQTNSKLWFDNIINAKKIWIDPGINIFFNNVFNDKECNNLPGYISDISVQVSQLEKGLVKELGSGLGYFYQLRGKVVQGNRIGYKLGYPTANLLPDDNRKIIPARGVYAAMVNTKGGWYKSMVNIGMRPTLSSKNFAIEAHLFDLSHNIYGENLIIHFFERLRDEKRFGDLEMLKEQLMKDKSKTLAVLEKPGMNFHIRNNFCFIKQGEVL